MRLELALELIWTLKGLETRSKMPLERDEPLPPERLEGVELRCHQPSLFWVDDRNAGLRYFAIDKDVRERSSVLGFDRARDFVDRPAGIGPPVRHRPEYVGRKLGAEPRPENADDQIGFTAVWDLLLKALVRSVVLALVLKKDWGEAHMLTKTALQPANNTRRTLALRHHVGRRRHENRYRPNIPRFHEVPASKICACKILCRDR